MPSTPDSPTDHAPPVDPLNLGVLLGRLAGGLLTLFVVFAALGFAMQEPLTQLSAWFVGEFGLIGLFIGVVVIDVLPLTHEPLLFLGYSGGLGFWPVWFTASVGSVCAGLISWSLGGRLAAIPYVARQFDRYRITAFFQRYGGWAIAIAAITPFPYSLAAWAAGAARIPFGLMLLGCLVRFVKVLLYLSLIALGWMAGGAGAA